MKYPKQYGVGEIKGHGDTERERENSSDSMRNICKRGKIEFIDGSKRNKNINKINNYVWNADTNLPRDCDEQYNVKDRVPLFGKINR